MKATKQILSHPNYSESDYNHLSGKGYTNKEILAIWDRDAADGKDACGAFDFNKTMQYFSN